jgi:hypothetical protein
MDAATAIIVAGIGLFGVLVGGMITAGANFVLAVRRERVEAQRDRRSNAIEVKRASRLIVLELSGAEVSAKICVEKRRWWVDPNIQLKTEAWRKYGDVLAPALSDAEWRAVSIAFVAVQQLLSNTEITVLEITDTLAAGISIMLRDIQNGRLALEPYASDLPPTVTRPQ